LDESGVASTVAELIVEALEVVDIEDDQPDGGLVPSD
jgi:hypothetical protein